MHQIAAEQELIELKPSAREGPATSIDDVLEYARQRSAARDLVELSERRLPELAPAERPFAKVMWLVVAIAVVWGHYYLVRSFWAPAHPGVDQNGYQVGGKLFSQTFSTGVKPTNPFTYVGWMWVQTTDGWVYPKYPLGVPMLDAACIWMAHDLHQGVVWSYLVSPVCTVLASAAMFLMLRMVASSFAAVLGTILIATNPVSLVLANNSNSHAPALAFTCWGILFLLWWMRHGGWWRGLIAGVLLGYALTIRYTEGLLVLPIAAAMLTSIRYKPAREIRWWAASAWVGAIVVGGMTMRYETFSVYGLHLVLPLVAVGIAIMIRRVFEFGPTQVWGYVGEFIRSCVCGTIAWGIIRLPSLYSISQFKDPIGTMLAIDFVKILVGGMIPLLYAIRWREPRSYLRPTCVLIGWLIPVVALVAYNKGAMGNWTGYDTTNESEGFTWDFFLNKWDFMVGQVYNTGLFFIAPMGIAGMILMFRKSARVAAVMTLWFVPGMLLYTAYYWGMNTNGVGYLRFFLTLFPPIVFCTAWLLDDVSRRSVDGFFRRGSIAGPIMAGVVVAIACGMNTYSARGALERDFTIQANLADAGEHIFGKTRDTYESDPKKRPLLFGEARGFLNYIQFAGNYECYSSDAFTTRGGNRMWRNQDPDAPNPLQHARIVAMQKVYEGKSDNDLWKEGNKIVDQALSDKRHVYAALPGPLMLGFKMRFSPKDYEVTTILRWHDPVTMSDEGKKALMAQGPAALFMGARATPQNWELVEITKKPPSVTPPPVKTPLVRAPVKTPVNSTTRPTTHPKALFEIK